MILGHHREALVARDRTTGLSARPTTAARRRIRAGSRSAAAAPRASARRTAAGPIPNRRARRGLGRDIEGPLRRIFAELAFRGFRHCAILDNLSAARSTDSDRTAHRRRQRLLVQGVAGQLLSRKRSSPTRCSPGTPSACRPSRSTIRSTRCRRRPCSRAWSSATPDTFRFAIKASRRITHDARLKAEDAADSVAYLYRNLATLGAKRGPVLFQLPPFLKKDLPRLEAFLALLPEGHNAAFEFRNESWFADDVYDALKRAGASLVSLRARRQRAAAARRDRAVRLHPPAARGIRRRRSAALGRATARDAMARDLRLLHARADRAAVRADAASACGCVTCRCPSTQKPITIEVDAARRVSGLLIAPDGRARLLRARAWRGRRHDASFHDGGFRCARGAAASRRCATSFRTWNSARSGPIRPPSRTPPCARRSPRLRAACPKRC